MAVKEEAARRISNQLARLPAATYPVVIHSCPDVEFYHQGDVQLFDYKSYPENLIITSEDRFTHLLCIICLVIERDLDEEKKQNNLKNKTNLMELLDTSIVLSLTDLYHCRFCSAEGTNRTTNSF